MVHTQLNKDSKQIFTKDSRGSRNIATKCTYPIVTTQIWNLIPADLLIELHLQKYRNGDNRCPKCEGAPHDVIHIFNCTKSPTDLKAIGKTN